ncbi:MAG TPA: nitroreductase family protein [Burkholderiaceae bacterium]|nr:nitroreductase family protein [Burkholderiaceae bacterium]
MSQARHPTHPIDPMFTSRWSPRAFTDEAIDAPTLLRFFEAARWAPSASNSQPWRFVYSLNGSPSWAPFLGFLVEFNREWARGAAALVLVVSRKTFVPAGGSAAVATASHSFDTGAAWISFAFQAQRDGWSTHAMGGFDKDLARRSLAIPDDYHLEAMVAVGRRGDPATLPDKLRQREQPNDRVPLARLVAEGEFGFRD